MKRNVVSIALMLLTVCFFASCNSYSTEKHEYYTCVENYVRASGTLEYIHFDNDSASVYLEFKDLSPAFDDVCFKIVGENVALVKQNGFNSLLKPGVQVSFISAPKYYGDGYVFPLVALSVNDNQLLDFEDGLSNFLDWLNSQ